MVIGRAAPSTNLTIPMPIDMAMAMSMSMPGSMAMPMSIASILDPSQARLIDPQIYRSQIDPQIDPALLMASAPGPAATLSAPVTHPVPAFLDHMSMPGLALGYPAKSPPAKPAPIVIHLRLHQASAFAGPPPDDEGDDEGDDQGDGQGDSTGIWTATLGGGGGSDGGYGLRLRLWLRLRLLAAATLAVS